MDFIKSLFNNDNAKNSTIQNVYHEKIYDYLNL